MKAGVFLNLLLLTLSFDVAAFTQFKPAVLNAALLFDHDATTGNVNIASSGCGMLQVNFRL
jgi:hypothetical protein